MQLGVALLHHLLETATVSVPVLDGCGMPIPGQMQVRMRCGVELWKLMGRVFQCHVCPWDGMPCLLLPLQSRGASTAHESAPAGLMCTESGNCSIHQRPIQADRARMRATWARTKHTRQ